MDSASCTAVRVLTSPAPWCSAGAPRSVAVRTMIRLTSAGEGRWPPCACAYAWRTRAAVAEVAAAAAPVLLAPKIGGGFAPWSMSAQPVKVVVSLLQSDQPPSAGATTLTVPGLNAVMPAELRALTLSFSQPPDESWPP